MPKRPGNRLVILGEQLDDLVASKAKAAGRTVSAIARELFAKWVGDKSLASVERKPGGGRKRADLDAGATIAAPPIKSVEKHGVCGSEQ